jgi:glycerophosphoryl diester phosphodiesterase
MTLGLGTDVASFPQFEDKMIANFTGVLDEGGPTVTILNDWFIKDFTLEELKNLTVEQKDIGIRPQFFNQLFKIPTFKEYLDTVHHNAFKMNQSIGIIPELKHSFFHNEIFNSTPKFMENLVLNTLTEYGYPMNASVIPQCSSAQDDHAPIPCGHLILQSFEFNCIKYLSEVTSVDKMMLISSEPLQLSLLTYQGLRDVANYAQYYSSFKEHLYIGILNQLEYLGKEYDKGEIGII